MDYSYFSAPPQPYHHFMGMSPNGFPHSGVDHDTIRSVVRIVSRGAAFRLAPRTSALQGVTNLTPQEPLDSSIFPAPYDAFAFHGLPTPQQGSPDATVALTPMPVGSVDSGLGDIDDVRGSRTRSSSEEKENLTPAQSRRKAQNRAAYALSSW
jgi:AP-1-like factor